MRIKKKILTAVLMALPTIALAVDTSKSNAQTFDAVLVSLMAFAVVLLIAILILGNTLIQLGFVYRDKMRKDSASSNIKSIVLLVLMLSSFAVNAQEAAPASTYVQWPTTIGGMAASNFYTLAGIILLELVVILSLVLTIRVLTNLISGKAEKAVKAKEVVKVNLWDRFNKVVPLEKENDILLEHNYDGIQELDNSLPPWWKYGFYLTIVVSIIYLWYYHGGGDGPSSYDEYIAEVEAGEEAKAAYLAKAANNVDENTVVLLDASGIAAGEVLFQSMCAACHAKDGGGGVGPNLTDAYWLHGGGIKDVFKSIKYGWADKGMKSWEDDFSPNQIAQISSYIMSLKGSAPAAPREKQGELYTDDAAPAVDTVNTETAKTVAVK